jgi:hypothetical protein
MFCVLDGEPLQRGNRSQWPGGAVRCLRDLTAPASICVLALVSLAGVALGQDAGGPPFHTVRYEENYEYLRDPAKRTEPLDRLKYIPIGTNEDDYISFGGDIRDRYEWFRNPLFGQEPQDNNGYLLQRYMVHADLHLGRFRFFGQLKSNLENGRTGGPRPADEDRLDLHQAFLEVRLAGEEEHGLAFRLGRQEIALGSSRLVSVREGPNVRQSFDGARLTWRASSWTVDALAARPVETNPGVFDDSPDHRRELWGVYAVGPLPLPKAHVDLYYLGFDRKRARFDHGTGRELRHSIGTRLWGSPEAWDYNFELVYQFGDFASGNIRAWTVASDTGYRMEAIHFRPRFGLKADATSGDHNPQGRTLGTFNALFPKGAYFSEADLIGPYNHIDLHPSVELDLTKRLTLTPDLDFFWRQSTRDGIYNIAGALIRSGRTSTARYIGSHADVQLDWKVNRHISLTGIYLHFFPGDFLKETRPAFPVNFIAAWVSYKL